MSRFLYKHLFADTPKPEFQYCDIPNPYTSGEGTYVACSETLFAVTLAGGGGPVFVHPYDQPGRMDTKHKLVNVHQNKVLDFQFNPFIDNVLATASADTTVKVTEVNTNPDDMKENILNADVTMVGHTKKVHLLRWHPTAQDILTTSSWDKTIKLWNVGTAECVNTFDQVADNTLSIEFNKDGSLLATTTKAKMMKLFDPRVPEKCVEEFTCCDGSKSSKVFWAESLNLLGVTCFNRAAKRMLRFWDLRKLGDKPVMGEVVDQGSAIMMPHFDSDTNVLYTAGKGDSSINIWEISSKGFKTTGGYRDTTPQKGGGWVPKRALDTKKCEVGRFMKLTAKSVMPLSFCVPRKTGSEVFQEDIYPDCFSGLPSMQPEEYLKGDNQKPVTMSMDPAKRDGAEKLVYVKKMTYAELQAENEELKARIATLEAELGADVE